MTEISEDDREELNRLYGLMQEETTEKGMEIMQEIIDLEIEIEKDCNF